MPLIVDREGTHKRALLTLLDELLHPIRDAIDAAVLVGSLAYNWDDDVFTTSDLDLMLVINRRQMSEVLQRCMPSNRDRPLMTAAVEYLEQGVVEMASIKSHRRDIGYTIHVLVLALLTAMSRWEVRDVAAWRSAPKSGAEELCGFGGRRLVHHARNDPLDIGVCHTVPTSIVHQGNWFVGIPHGRLLHAPRVLMDNTDTVANAFEALWGFFMAQFVAEAEIGIETPIDSCCDGLLKSLAKSHHYGRNAKARLMGRTREYLMNLEHQ